MLVAQDWQSLVTGGNAEKCFLHQTSGAHRSFQHVGRGRNEGSPDLKRGNKIEERTFMKRVALAAILLALAVSASASRTSMGAAQTGNDLLQLLPDGHAVIVVDLQRVTTSSLWATLSTQNKIKAELDKAQ